jgi:negative regulator of sigma E activity
LVLCQLCKKHYHRVGAEMCKECFFKAHPDIVKARELMIAEQATRIKAAKKAAADKRAALKKKHPCRKYRAGGVCGQSAIGSRCQYGVRTAVRKCADYLGKVPA